MLLFPQNLRFYAEPFIHDLNFNFTLCWESVWTCTHAHFQGCVCYWTKVKFIMYFRNLLDLSNYLRLILAALHASEERLWLTHWVTILLCRVCLRVLKSKHVGNTNKRLLFWYGEWGHTSYLLWACIRIFRALVNWKRFFGIIGELFVHIFLSTCLYKYAF